MTAFLIVVAMAWAGFASSSYALEPSKSAVSAQSRQAADMKDCPAHKSSVVVKMDVGKCAMYCYGLMSALAWQGFNPLQRVEQMASAYGFPLPHIDGHILASSPLRPTSLDA